MDKKRIDLYHQIEEKRNSKLLVYFTGDRPGLETRIADDATEYFVEHLDKIGSVKKITLMLYTLGGSTLAGWNIVNLIRQFCEDFEIIIPSKCRSAGTLICLGANRIIMTKQATMGPIDPSITTSLNPEIPGAGPQAKFPVSVEAIKGFLELPKHELSIKDDNALSLIFNVLAEKVHPLVLGEVYRAIGQIQMLAEKLLVNQVTDKDKVKKIIAFLCSESGSHDYTINSKEASEILGLNVESPDEDLYSLIKDTYNDIRDELELLSPFDPNAYLESEQQKKYVFRRCLIESIIGGTDVFVSKGSLSKVLISPMQLGLPEQKAINDQRSFEGWEHEE